MTAWRVQRWPWPAALAYRAQMRRWRGWIQHSDDGGQAKHSSSNDVGCPWRRRWDPAGSSKTKQAAKFVKVVVDGAPYLRKVDLEAYTGYDLVLGARSRTSSSPISTSVSTTPSASPASGYRSSTLLCLVERSS